MSSLPIRKRRVSEVCIPNGLRNDPVKCRKIEAPYAAAELFKLHTLSAFIGMRGSGKTHSMVTLARKYLEDGSFTRVFIISPTYESNPIFHVLKADKGDIYSNLNTSIADIENILKKCKQDSDDYDDYEYYMKAYSKWKRRAPLKLEEETMLENNNHMKPPEVVPRPSPLLIIDDMSHSEIYSTSRTNPFINLCLRHRHINGGKGISIFMAAQTFKTGIPLPLRQNIQQYFLWPTRDETQLEAMYHEVANLVDHDTFIELYQEATKRPHSFLTIDNNAPHPSLQFRSSFNKFLMTS